MKVAIFREVVDVHSIAALHQHLRYRHESRFGAFWLTHANGNKLAMLVSYDAALLHFFTAQDGPFYFSVGKGSPDEEIPFLADNYESSPMTADHAVPLTDAMTVVDEFYATGQRSERIKWDDLSNNSQERSA